MTTPTTETGAGRGGLPAGLLPPLVALAVVEAALVATPAGLGYRLVAALAALGLFLATIVALWRARRGQRDLGRARDRAERARVEAELLAGVSRELRGPLEAIGGTVDLLDHTPLSATQRDCVATIRRSSTRMLRTIEDIRDLSRKEEGALAPRRTRFSLPALAESTTHTLTPLAEEKGLTLVCDVAPALPDLVLGDPDLLGRALEKLLRSAIERSGRGEVVFRVHPEGDDGRGSALVAFSASVSEAGPPSPGTGERADLGFAVATRLAERMGGRIHADATPGAAPRFRLVVPLAPDPEPAPADAAEVSLQGLRALVLESATGDRETFGRLLRSLGLEPTLVGEADAAVAELRRAADEGRPYAVALLDASTRGAAALRARRKEDDPLLASTPKIQTWSPSRLAASMQDTGPRVLKPPSRASLLAALHRALGAESEASGGAPSSGETVPASARAGVRVLIVDDSPVTALVTSRIVESAGGEPLVASGPEPVERALAAQSIAVVVLDASRPEHRDLEARLREGHPGLTLVSTPVGEAQLRAVLARAGRPTPFPREIEGGFDRRRLARNLGDDERAADQVLAAFVAQAGPLLDTLRSARASGDLPSVARGAHRLKGSLLWIGAERGAAAVSSLESRASDGDRDGTRMALDAVESEVGAVVAEIRKTTIS